MLTQLKQELMIPMTEVIAISETSKPTRLKMVGAFALVILSYVIAFGAAFGIGYGLTGLVHPLWLTLIADIGATIVIFIFSVIFNNVSFYDPYWSIQPVFIVVYWMLLPQASGASLIRQIVIMIIVSFYAIRLTLNWIRGWKGLKHEDWRYVKFRVEKPKLFWFIAFTGLEMMPTLIVFLACIPLYPALVLSSNTFGVFDIIAIVIAIGAISIEFVADEQMKIFVRMSKDPKKVMDLGLWAYSRHPNYFGEVSFWWGLFFFALAADLTWWWTVAGGIAMIILFIFISIPLLENKQLANRPDYADYKKRVSMFIPWFPRK